MLDLVSGGRVELGTGETSSGAELEGFGVDRETKRAQWEEMLPVVARMMVEEPFAGADGRFLTMPPRNVVPKPVQKPHPPLWVACSRRETIRLAAEKGIGALSFSFVEPEEARAWVDEYHAIIEQRALRARRLRGQPAGGVRAADDVRARRGAGHRARHRRRALLRLLAGALLRLRRPPPGRTNIYEEFLARRDDVGFARSIITADAAPLGVRVLQQGLGSLRGAIGSPEQVRDLCRRYEAAGVDQLIFVMQAGPQPPRAHLRVDRAVRLRGHARVRRSAPTRPTRERAERFAPAIAAALARREPPRVADPGLLDRARRLRAGGPAPRARAVQRPPAAVRGSRRCWPSRASARSRPSCGAPTIAAWSAPRARRAG